MRRIIAAISTAEHTTMNIVLRTFTAVRFIGSSLNCLINENGLKHEMLQLLNHLDLATKNSN
jgi:hypothetical protein